MGCCVRNFEDTLYSFPAFCAQPLGVGGKCSVCSNFSVTTYHKQRAAEKQPRLRWTITVNIPSFCFVLQSKTLTGCRSSRLMLTTDYVLMFRVKKNSGYRAVKTMWSSGVTVWVKKSDLYSEICSFVKIKNLNSWCCSVWSNHPEWVIKLFLNQCPFWSLTQAHKRFWKLSKGKLWKKLHELWGNGTDFLTAFENSCRCWWQGQMIITMAGKHFE